MNKTLTKVKAQQEQSWEEEMIGGGLLVQNLLTSLLSNPVPEASAASSCLHVCLSCLDVPISVDGGRDSASCKRPSDLLEACELVFPYQ